METYKDIYLDVPEWKQRRNDRNYVRNLIRLLTKHEVISWEVQGEIKITNIVLGEKLANNTYNSIRRRWGIVEEN